MGEGLDIVEGWTGPIDFQLKEDDVAANLTGDTVIAQAVTRRRVTSVLTGDLSILAATDGKVRLTPDTGDFLAAQSPYELRFKRTLAGGGDVWYPSGEAVLLKVRPWPATST